MVIDPPGPVMTHCNINTFKLVGTGQTHVHTKLTHIVHISTLFLCFSSPTHTDMSHLLNDIMQVLIISGVII